MSLSLEELIRGGGRGGGHHGGGHRGGGGAHRSMGSH